MNETPSFNIIEYLYFYNGGGVSLGDINNDGLIDIYLSSNQDSNRLYLNLGDFHFQDITKKANVCGFGNWKTGISMVDINGDGWLDIFSCGVGDYKQFNSRNQVYINNGDQTFTEKSESLGLSFQGFSTQYAFLDYDLDGDLDIYLLNHSVHSQYSFGKASSRLKSDSLAGDVLYRNELVPQGNFYFTDVTKEAGIYNSAIGYGLGVGVSDVNNDGYPDLYVSNDFSENDYLYINNKDGSFRDATKESLSHTSRFSMGNDLADLNNDLLTDIITVDMRPQDEAVIKTTAGEDNYELWKFKLNSGYQTQVARNTVQLNTGVLDSSDINFIDVSQLSGMEATDWSWCPLIFDADGDGLKDIFIANGILRRPNDLDYIHFISSDSAQKKIADNSLPWIDLMPNGSFGNFFFKNINGLQFANRSQVFGFGPKDFSTGAAYGDLNNDGVPDLVINRINDEALILKNTTSPNNFITVSLEGDSKSFNHFGIGSKVSIESKKSKQLQEVYPTRGWESSSETKIHFGIQTSLDSIKVRIVWPGGLEQIESVDSRNKKIKFNPTQQQHSTDVNKRIFEYAGEIPFTHKENDFNAFSRERLIPYMLTTEGPPIAVGDINGDRLDDFYIGGGKGQSGELYFQTQSGGFIRDKFNQFSKTAECEDVDACFFDADGDHDLDLVIVAGGQEDQNTTSLLPSLYLNQGNAKFLLSREFFPKIFPNASCVKPYDYDLDGDMDLFIGSAVMPYLYGIAPECYLLDNDGKGLFTINKDWLGNSKFENPTKVHPGLVKDAAWVDFNYDDLIDLVLLGDWMPITVLLQTPNHQFINKTYELGFGNTRGWWNSLAVADVDNDGNDDLIAGNLGLNTRLKASVNKPLQLFLGDFDSNSGSDHIVVYYNGDKKYPFTSRDELVKQIPSLKKKFLKYSDYRDVILDDIITPVQIGNSALMQAEVFESVILINENGNYKIQSLPIEAQLTPIYAIAPYDYDGDKYEDIILGGNLLATQPEIGPLDASVGTYLKGTGSGSFTSIKPVESGIRVKGEIRDIKILRGATKNYLLVSRNNQTPVYYSFTK